MKKKYYGKRYFTGANLLDLIVDKLFDLIVGIVLLWIAAQYFHANDRPIGIYNHFDTEKHIDWADLRYYDYIDTSKDKELVIELKK